MWQACALLLALALPAGILAVRRAMRQHHSEAAAAAEAKQYERASPELIGGLVKLASHQGQRSFIENELESIQRAQGQAGVRVGHVVWLSMKLDGRVARDASSPDFSDGR